MDAVDAATADPGDALLDLYPTAVGEVYGYHLHRCRDATVAEDLTADTFMAAVASIRRNVVDDVTVAWLIGIARHKLVDHWRRLERERRNLTAVGSAEPSDTDTDDRWDTELDGFLARDVLDRLGAHHRTALTLRYVDDLPVADVAAVMDRTVHGTEALLVRARRAFRELYDDLDGHRDVRNPDVGDRVIGDPGVGEDGEVNP